MYIDNIPATLVAIYARYSTDKQDDRSIADQIRRCEEYAAKKGWTVVARYGDEAESGTHMQREQLQLLLAAASSKGKPFSIVLIDDHSRLSRDIGDAWSIVYGKLAAACVTVVIHETQAEVIRSIFRDYAAGGSFQKIAAALNAEGLPSPYSDTNRDKTHGWATGTIRTMLMNDRYIGILVWNKRKFVRVQGKKTRKATMRPRSEWKVAECPPLISRELWDRVHARMSVNGAATRGRGRPAGAGEYPYLLSGLLKCGECGGTMIVTGARKKNGARYATFGCSTVKTKGEALCKNKLAISEKLLDGEAVQRRVRDLHAASLQELARLAQPHALAQQACRDPRAPARRRPTPRPAAVPRPGAAPPASSSATPR